jgi:hypothetical protein
MLAFVGAVLAYLALYIQYVSMDLGRFSLARYLARDVHMLTWWQLVALPLATGASYLIVALVCLLRQRSPQVALLVFAACLSVALALFLFGSWAGIYAGISLLALMVEPAWALLSRSRRAT